jgi:hypothetical protein
MNDLKKLLPDEKHLSAVDLRKLPADERSAILGAQAALAAVRWTPKTGPLGMLN